MRHLVSRRRMKRSPNRIKTNLVHDGNASLLGRSIELQHGRADVAGRDDMLLVADSRLDDGGVVRVRDQADDKVMLGNLGVQGLLVVDIEGDGVCVLDARGELLGCCECPARWEGVSSMGIDPGRAYRVAGYTPTATWMPASLRMSSVGLVTKPAPSMSTDLWASRQWSATRKPPTIQKRLKRGDGPFSLTFGKPFLLRPLCQCQWTLKILSLVLDLNFANIPSWCENFCDSM